MVANCILCKKKVACFKLGNGKLEYCSICRPKNARNSTLCTYRDPLTNELCYKRGKFSSKRCKAHILNNDKCEVKHERCINITNGIRCKKQACCGVSGDNRRRKWCVGCSPEGSVNFNKKTCSRCGERKVHTNYIKKHDGLCGECYRIDNRDKMFKRVATRTEEIDTGRKICAAFPDKKWVFDKRIKGGKSLRRPDIQLVLPHCIIVIEIDENQHKFYDKTDERQKEVDMFGDSNVPVVIIRLNPHSYRIISSAQNIKSPWNRQGQLIDGIEWNRRISSLCKTVNDYNVKDHRENTLIRLFYDE